MRHFSGLSVFWRLMAFLPVTFLMLGLAIALGANENKTLVLENEKSQSRNAVEIAQGIVSLFQQQEQSGALTREQAQAQAKATIRGLRFDKGKNYIFIQRLDGVTQLLPLRPQMEGVNRLDETDVDGVPFIRRQIEAARAGGDFVFYKNKMADGTSQKKVSFMAPFVPWDWVIGCGVNIVDVDEHFFAVLRQSLAIGGVLLLITTVVVIWLSRSISQPIHMIADQMDRLASGEPVMDIPLAEQTNEIGRLAHSFTVFKQGLEQTEELRRNREAYESQSKERQQKTVLDFADTLEREVKSVIDIVGSVSREMLASAETITATTDSARQLTSGLAQGANDAIDSVQAASAAADQLNSSCGEISRQVEKSSQVAAEAAEEAEHAAKLAQGLNTAAQKIGAVVDLITAIAQQTNLLALNATIEAARAGDAGKGFAVVAGEVKNLANQTAHATDNIARQVGEIQTVANHTAEGIGRSGHTIRKINEAASAIAGAIEQQSQAAHSISSSIAKVVQSTGQVSSAIGGLSDAAKASDEAASNVAAIAADLSRGVSRLSRTVDQLVTTLRAG